MVRTQISLDDRHCELLAVVAADDAADRTEVIRATVDELVRLSGQTAAEALLALAAEFATPGMADLAEHHDEVLGSDRWWP